MPNKYGNKISNLFIQTESPSGNSGNIHKTENEIYDYINPNSYNKYSPNYMKTHGQQSNLGYNESNVNKENGPSKIKYLNNGNLNNQINHNYSNQKPYHLENNASNINVNYSKKKGY